MKNIAVFCASSTGFDPVFSDQAKKLGRYLALNGMTLVYGGANRGLMGVLADSAIENGGEVIGVIPDLIREEEVAHTGITKLIFTKKMSQRKEEISKLADGYIALAGGFGTLDELFETLTLGQLGIESKPVGILNTKGYFDFLTRQLDVMVASGFLHKENRNMLLVADTIEELVSKMEAYKPLKVSKIVKTK